MNVTLPQSIDQTSALLSTQGYVADRALSVSVFLALKMGKPLFLEGEPGTGKTEIAKVLSSALGRRLLRLQCYEGLDAASAVYEWNYAAQMIEIRLAEAAHSSRESIQTEIFSERFLIKRPLLEALEPQPGGPPVLLIDELDRADEPFEAFLLEILSDFQVTVPETGTIRAAAPPIVIITSNRTREIHDAVKRRCLYHWVDYPSLERELEILKAKAPDLPAELSRQVAAFVQTLRGEDLFKKPGVAETIDWAAALAALDTIALTPEAIRDSIGVLLKYQDDIAKLTSGETARLIDEARMRAAA
jgi:MoxR-like ATPase